MASFQIKLSFQIDSGKLISKQKHYNLMAPSRPIKKGKSMKPDRIRKLCHELAEFEQSSSPELMMNKIMTVANREQIPLPVLYTLYDKFAVSETGNDQPARIEKVEICMGKACQAKGAAAILEHFKLLASQTSDRSAVQTTYKVRTCTCLGRCSKAPVVIMNKKVLEKFNPGE